MTARTRRRLTVLFALGLVTLPAEAFLFPVAMTPDPRVAAESWVEGLSTDELMAASSEIEHYPAIYRRAIMGELDPADRSQVWQAQFGKYLAAHPNLTAEQIAVVQDAIAVATPAAFAPPVSEDVKVKVQKVFNRAMATLGPKDAGELFVTLGPKVVTSGNALPLTQQLADSIRSWRVVSANIPDCNCNIDIDTCDLVPDPWLQCSEQYTCSFDMNWPMCGPLWSWACTGWCRLLRWPMD